MPSVADVVAWIERRYPPDLAESWDAVGLVCGHPAAVVTRILVTVDVTQAVVDEAVATGTNFILAHHPLLLAGVNSVAATDNKGRILHQLIEAGCALMTAHTNADAGADGVSDALAAALGVIETRPLVPIESGTDKLVVFVPAEQTGELIDALAAAGAGEIDTYERCAYTLAGTGTFRPLRGSNPAIGSVGQISEVSETRIEMVLPRSRRAAVVAALLRAHPYEAPAFDVTEIAAPPTVPGNSAQLGIGRIGRLDQSMTLGSFAQLAASQLPRAEQGLRIAGDLAAVVHSVAVCGGSGHSLLEAATEAGADVYLTADLKHHRVSDHLADGGCAVIDVAHWASEYPWCDRVASSLRAEFGGGDNDNDTGTGTRTGDDMVTVDVCEIVTDPWSHQLRSSH